MSYAIIRDGHPEPVSGRFTDNAGIQHPVSVLRLWPEAELAAIDVYPIIETPLPDGHCLTASALQWDAVARTVTRAHVTQEIPLTERKARMAAAVRDKRRQVETGGCVVNGVLFRTDDKSQAKIDAAVALFDKDPELTAIDFEAQPDLWVSLDKETITAIGVAAGRHVQAAFSRARALSEAIIAATSHAGLDAIDIDAGWPGGTLE